MSPRDKFAALVAVCMFSGLASIVMLSFSWWPVWGTQLGIIVMAAAPICMAFADDYIEKKDAKYYETHPQKPIKPYKPSKWDPVWQGGFLFTLGLGLIIPVFVILPELQSQEPVPVANYLANVMSGPMWGLTQISAAGVGGLMCLGGLIFMGAAILDIIKPLKL